MKSIIVVSPDYLHAFDNVMQKLNIQLYGYGSWELAFTSIVHCDMTSLLGVVYLSETIDVGNKFMHALLKTLENSAKTVKVLFSINEDEGNTLSSMHGVYPKLKLVQLDPFINLTDQYVLQSVIGNLLISNMDPYLLKELDVEDDTTRHNMLEYRRVLSKEYCELFNEINGSTNAEAKRADKISTDSRLYKLLRKKRINNYFGVTEDIVDEMLNNELSEVKSDKLWCLYKCVEEV